MRDELPARYQSVTAKLTHKTRDGEQHLIATYGVKGGKVKSVFCSSFKAGSEMNTLAMDGCKLMSLLLQHGYGAVDLAGKLAHEETSILGTLARGAVEIEQ